MKRFALVALVAVLAAVPRLSADPVPVDHVVLGWDEFMKLWTKSQTPRPDPDKPPVDATLTRAEYTGVVREQSTDIAAIFEISVLADRKWVRVPFLPASAGLREATIDGVPASIVTDGESHAVVLKGAGRRTLRVNFSIPTGARDGDSQFDFRTVATPMTLVAFSFAQPELDIHIEPAQALTLRTENHGTQARAVLPPTQNVHVFWRRRQPAERELPAKIYARLRELVTVDDGVLRLNVQSEMSVLQSGVNRLQMRVPEAVSVLNVAGENIQGWNVDKGVLGIVFDRRVKGERSLVIQAERPLASADAAVTAPVFEAIGVVRQEISVGIEAVGNIEVTASGTTGLRQVDVKELPSPLWSQGRNPLLYGFTGTDAAGVINLAVTRHEDVPVLASTVDSANAVTVLTKDGQSVTRVAFYVRNHLKQFLTMTLPDGAEIWSAFVNGRAVKPSRKKAGEILIPLDKSGLGENDGAFPVEIVYYGRSSSLGLAGESRSALPKIDLPISQLLWSVYAPETLDVLHAGGNVDADQGILAPNGVIVDEVRSEVRKDKSGYLLRAAKKVMEMAKNEPSRDVASRQAVMEVDDEFQAGAPAAAPLEDHVLPIAFRIPETGRLYRFSKIMITREAPSVDLTYARRGFIGFAETAAMLVLALVAYLRRRAVMDGLRRLMALTALGLAHLRTLRDGDVAR